MKEIFRDEGIILRLVDYNDTGVVADIMTKRGIRGYFIKGVRNIKSSNHIFSTYPSKVSFLYVPHEDISTITEISMINNYIDLKSDLKKFYIFSCCLEKILFFKTEIKDVPTLYTFLEKFLDKFVKSDYPYAYLELFEVKLLYLLGVNPSFSRCAKCGSYMDLMGFSIKNGGMICKDCLQSDFLIKNNIKDLEKLYKIKIDNVTDNDLKDLNSFSSLLDEYYLYHLSFTSKAKKVMKTINNIN